MSTHIIKQISPGYILIWIEKIQTNLQNFKKKSNLMSIDEKLDFIRHQYLIISLINSALDGRVKFIGAYHKQQSKEL